MEIDRDLVRGSTSMLILSLLHEEGALYGYQITKLIKERSEGLLDFKEGTLYPALYRLEDEGAITSEWIAKDSRKRRYYRITSKGMERLEQKKREWRTFIGSIRGVMGDA